MRIEILKFERHPVIGQNVRRTCRLDAIETPTVSARSPVSAGGRSARKSQTCRRSYLLLAGSSLAYLLLAGSSAGLIFIGWLLLRRACVGQSWSWRWRLLAGRPGPTLIALSAVWEKHTGQFPPSQRRHTYTHTSYCLSLVPPTSPTDSPHWSALMLLVS